MYRKNEVSYNTRKINGNGSESPSSSFSSYFHASCASHICAGPHSQIHAGEKNPHSLHFSHRCFLVSHSALHTRHTYLLYKCFFSVFKFHFTYLTKFIMFICNVWYPLFNWIKSTEFFFETLTDKFTFVIHFS